MSPGAREGTPSGPAPVRPLSGPRRALAGPAGGRRVWCGHSTGHRPEWSLACRETFRAVKARLGQGPAHALLPGTGAPSCLRGLAGHWLCPLSSFTQQSVLLKPRPFKAMDQSAVANEMAGTTSTERWDLGGYLCETSQFSPCDSQPSDKRQRFGFLFPTMYFAYGVFLPDFGICCFLLGACISLCAGFTRPECPDGVSSTFLLPLAPSLAPKFPSFTCPSR